MALDKIGPYRFQGVLGRGGMGTVYRGVHEDTGELHAIKVLAPTYAHDDHFRGRFESEIKALIQLDHKNIVRLLSYGQEDGMLFFSMELVPGNSLFQMQKKKHRFNWLQILRIAKDVGEGLRHAHHRGIIHRDLKPGNLLMTVDENGKPDYVKITDFGIAKRFGTSQNTGNNVLGTMDFMSPEQAKGEPVTIQSDLFSLGTVLFTLLSGKPPFTSNSVEESLRNLTRVPAPRVSSVVPGVPPGLDELIKRLMEKRPEKRIPTTQALLHQIKELEATLKDHSEAQTHVNKPLTDEAFDVSAPKTTENTGLQIRKSSNKTNAVSGPSPTIELTDHDKNLAQPPATPADYFNTVTDQIRQKQVVGGDDAHVTKGFWPLVLAFASVILLGAVGIYYAYKPPSAEELFTAIEASANRPNLVLIEINEFLLHHPDEPRNGQVAELKRIGEAIALYNSLCNTLSVRKNLPGENRLSEIETQFLSIVDLADEDPAMATAKMSAFVTVHDSTKLSPGDQKCVNAAKSYKIKIENDAKSKILFNLQQIRSAMKNAAQTTDPDSAIPIYQSILELYGNVQWGTISESDEGRQLVQKAKDILLAMEEAQKKNPSPEKLPLTN